MTGNNHAGIRRPDYVPPPCPAKADRLIGAHYFPGWKPGVHTGWSALTDYPERRPLLGWYDESNPEVTDWEIKWALEHGVGFFVYCWYRHKDNAGRPVTIDDGVRMGHAIHEGLFHARYRDMFQFAIMWENFGKRGMIASLDDLKQNLLPFWIEQYFSKPFYLRLDDRPVLFIYHLDSLVEQTGGIDGARQALDIIRAGVAGQGLGNPMLLCEHRGASVEFLNKAKTCGLDAVFAYCWPTQEQFPTIEQAFDQQLAKMEAWKDLNVLPFPPTASVGWDPMPWARENPDTPWLHKEAIKRWYAKPAEFETLLRRIKALTAEFPAGDIARRMLILDNWNEWAEGHFISPGAAAGFGYLQAVRKAFTTQDNIPDYRTPDVIGLGPYGPPSPGGELATPPR